MAVLEAEKTRQQAAEFEARERAKDEERRAKARRHHDAIRAQMAEHEASRNVRDETAVERKINRNVLSKLRAPVPKLNLTGIGLQAL